MGIPGLYKHLGSGTRISLATLSAQHYVQHQRPLRLAIDISIWLFQIQAGQGGSNPALRTFYYRLLRLISLNIHPLFVFDGANKPLFKRDKRVGGPGVRVASVPEFLAKQLLKQFGFPMHVAPGEAEAECALLQKEGVVDAVLSEDVDTIMFGSALTLRNWTAEGTTKTPTHVNVYKESEIMAASGLDTQGMVLVALMSGGDYIPQGIPGCGIKFAVDAARAGFGKRLCSMTKRDTALLREWREELQMEFRTNVSKYFSRRNTTLVVPDNFPNFEVLGYYTHPCVSSLDRVEQLRRSLQWDMPLDLPALRSFAGDAFDWHNRGGAIKFMRNLSQSLLPQRLRLAAEQSDVGSNLGENDMLQGVHSVRTHLSTDNAKEIRVSYIPANVVPIDLSLEPQDVDVETETAQAFEEDEVGDDLGEDDGIPRSPSKRPRTIRPYEESQPEKMWVLRDWVQLGCPSMLEDYEASLRLPRKPAASKARTTRAAPAKARTRGSSTSKNSGMPNNALMRHVQSAKPIGTIELEDDCILETFYRTAASTKSMLPTVREKQGKGDREKGQTAVLDAIGPGPTATISTVPVQRAHFRPPNEVYVPRTPKKRRTAEVSTPQSGRSNITDYFSPSKRANPGPSEVIDLLTPSPRTTTAIHTTASQTIVARNSTVRAANRELGFTLQVVSGNAAKSAVDERCRPRGSIQKSLSMPMSQDAASLDVSVHDSVECLDLAQSPAQLKASSSLAAVTLQHGHGYTIPPGHPVVLPVSTIDLSSFNKPFSSTALQPGPITSKQLAQAKSSVIKIRESLDGAWTMATTDILDLSGLDATTVNRGTTQAKKSNARTWRLSAVDTVDLTDA